ncbi:MAG TPA: MFS transporter, partial [Stellaceae bacterium]|nr:MFS transporter [Stellaceae bacterium]
MTGAAFTHREILRILAGILLCMALGSLDQTMLVTALPAIAGEFRSVPHLSWAITAYLLMSTIATVIFGKLSDLYGRRILLETAIGVFLAASVACALAPGMGTLIAARALQGVGGGGLVSMTQASIADIVSARERGRYQAYITCTFGAASLAGPLIGGLCAQYLSWRVAFWINVPLGLLAFALSHRGLMRVPVRRAKHPIDFLGAALMLPGVTAVMLAIAWGGTELPWGSPQLLSLLGAGAVLLAAFAAQELRASDALLPPRLYANPVVRVATVLNFLCAIAMYGNLMLLPVYLQFVKGVGAGTSGAMLIPPLTVQIITSILTGRELRRSGRYVLLLRAGFASLAAAALLFSGMDSLTPFWRIELYMACNCVGIGLLMAPLWVAIQNAADFRDIGAVTGSTGFFRALGGAFGSALVWSVLLYALDAVVTREGHPQYGSNLLRGGRAAIAALPEDARAIVIPALAHGFGTA